MRLNDAAYFEIMRSRSLRFMPHPVQRVCVGPADQDILAIATVGCRGMIRSRNSGNQTLLCEWTGKRENILVGYRDQQKCVNHCFVLEILALQKAQRARVVFRQTGTLLFDIVAESRGQFRGNEDDRCAKASIAPCCQPKSAIMASHNISQYKPHPSNWKQARTRSLGLELRAL